MKDTKGKEILKELVKKADALIENFRPGVMDKLGLGYDVLEEINPQLVYLEISGFGGYGRYSRRPGYDLLAQAMGGMMSVTGEKGGKPTRAGTAVGDLGAGIYGALGVLAVLNACTVIGHGQKEDVALLDTIVSLMENYLIRYRYTGKAYVQNGNAYPAIAPYESFAASDGDYVLACGNQSLFERFAKEVAGHEEWITDPRFENNVIRTENAEVIKQIIEDWSKQFTSEEIVDRCLKAGVPAGGNLMDFNAIIQGL
ncbi:MAG: CoA transferase [Lachnospiraceae bacterium]|nr:CoA transferase [Lachnospiraceae bacterium]